MRDLGAELKSLRPYGMASAWADLVAQGGGASLDASRWLVEHLGGVPAEQAFGGFVDVGDAAAGVGAVKALGH